MRSLATIQRIAAVHAIPKADAIVTITFRDTQWECIMKKSEAEPDKLVVYFEIDSLLPHSKAPFDEMEFLEKVHWRIKTIKLRGQISQGLALPLDALLPYLPLDTPLEDGTDLTELLGVRKYIANEERGLYDPPRPNREKPPPTFPSWITRTEESRGQTFPNLKQVLAELDLFMTVKMDGTSATYFVRNGEFGMCSRNHVVDPLDTSAASGHYAEIAGKYNIEQVLRSVGYDVAVQGEICGPKINGNRVKLDSNQFFIFTAQNLETGQRLSPSQLNEFVETMNRIQSQDSGKEASKFVQVPSLGVLKAGTCGTFKEVVAFSEGTFVVTKEAREGIVARTEDGRSFKVINPKYLLKHDL
ncbi:hypothetical protein BJ741DRAFT_633098 [Chytriomyces cf. hyalinus JEL632]|nr:hypothetical protein BJ741DRAFT_633098 [Chytriomyces cf. hyalinus JEL632]